jgi:hypothetical protein
MLAVGSAVGGRGWHRIAASFRPTRDFRPWDREGAVGSGQVGCLSCSACSMCEGPAGFVVHLVGGTWALM